MPSGDRWFFHRVARVYDHLMPPAAPGPLRDGLALADGSVERVLDVGGGTGRAVRAVDAPTRVVVDATPAMLRRVPSGLGRVLGSAPALPVADNAVDAVLVVDALHHLPAPARVLSEAYRVLRPGGVVVVREFDRGTVRGRLLELAEHAIRMDSAFLTAADLRGRLDDAGFEARILDGGFSCTVAGRKPGGP
ncbi:MAG: class I SAM-dependent methyltransferase [Halobacteriales archaeon]